ncbi:hypothetical protein FOMPIDRAFT_114923 [Fomitopsis schrenkii]|uniref:Uncharacterized protein n=1 Tax=Fomitopsis schrenkii TaxID=2126942 RepID=S8ESV0_FOMSC|nr:hypothetical protein FOMPIDRAFT_114923 [Fomitopsis schrenkii]
MHILRTRARTSYLPMARRKGPRDLQENSLHLKLSARRGHLWHEKLGMPVMMCMYGKSYHICKLIVRRTVGRLRDEHNIQKLDGQRKRLISGNGCWLECGLALAGIDLCILRPMNCGARGGAEEAVYLSHSMRPGKSKHSGGTRVCASHIPSTRRLRTPGDSPMQRTTRHSRKANLGFDYQSRHIRQNGPDPGEFGVEDVSHVDCVDLRIMDLIACTIVGTQARRGAPEDVNPALTSPPIAIVGTEARVGPDGHSRPGRIHKCLQCLDVEHGAHANIASDVIRYIKATTRDWEEQWHKLPVCEREFRKIAGRGSWQRV